MGRPRLKVRFRVPPYVSPRAAWRRRIHAAAARAIRQAGVEYGPDDALELDVTLYLRGRALGLHDVDNRLKDIMDALQGHVGGTGKKHRALPPLIPNDCQVFRVTIEKLAPPKQSRGLGHVVVASHAAGRRRRTGGV
jgi:hypothetical protein